MLKTTGARLFTALLGYVILIILLLTLNPFFIVIPDHFAFEPESSLKNIIGNILLFLPVGFLYRLSTQRRGALVLGAVMSMVIEALQLFLPDRTTSIVDILSNTVGAGLGAFIHNLLSTWFVVKPALVSRLRLETPLMGLIYLQTPLLWVNILALEGTPTRWVLAALIGVCGAIIIGDLFRHWHEGILFDRMGQAALITGVWFIVGTGPGLLNSLPTVATILGLMLLTAVWTALPPSNSERRFERFTLRRLFPIFVLYLLLLTVWSPFTSFGAWHANFGFTDRITDTSMQSLYPRLEYVIAFTILGYLISEWRGRLELPLRKDLPRLFIVAFGVALVLEFLSGFQIGRGASFMRLVLAVVGALFGGTIYYLSREHIRFLLGHPSQ